MVKIMIYKSDEGKSTMFVLPEVATRLPPLLLKGVTKENCRAEVAKALAVALGKGDLSGAGLG